MALGTTATNSANLHLYYEKKMLDVLEPRLVFFNLGKKQRLPKNNGKQVKWLRYSRIAGSTSALSEGVAPSEINFTTANVTATVAQYGQFSKVTDLLSDTAIDDVLDSLAERFGRSAADSIEQLIVAELASASTLQRVNDRVSDVTIVAGDVLSHTELIEAMIDQKSSFIGPHESGKYSAVLAASQQFDMLSDTATGSWLDINKFVGQAQPKIMNGEFGEIYGIRLMVSDKTASGAGLGAGGIDVHNAYLVGEEAFGVVELNGKSLEMIVKDHKSGGVANPLNQFATVGYKINGFVAKYLDSGSKRVMNIRSSSAL